MTKPAVATRRPFLSFTYYETCIVFVIHSCRGGEEKAPLPPPFPPRCALARHSSSHAPRRSRCALASSAARAARSPVTARHKLLRWSWPFPPRGWPRVASFWLGGRASNSARVQSSTAALRGRSSKLKCSERAAGAASSHGLPNHPHAQSHKLFDNCSPHLIGSGPQLS